MVRNRRSISSRPQSVCQPQEGHRSRCISRGEFILFHQSSFPSDVLRTIDRQRRCSLPPVVHLRRGEMFPFFLCRHDGSASSTAQSLSATPRLPSVAKAVRETAERRQSLPSRFGKHSGRSRRAPGEICSALLSAQKANTLNRPAATRAGSCGWESCQSIRETRAKKRCLRAPARPPDPS